MINCKLRINWGFVSNICLYHTKRTLSKGLLLKIFQFWKKWIPFIFQQNQFCFFQALKWNQTQLNPQTIYKRIKLCNIWICVNSVRIKCGAQCNEDKSKLNSCNNICFFDVMPSYRNIQNYKKIAIQSFRWKHM